MNTNMMRNKVQLIGNLGQAPEIRKADNGQAMARLSLATNESYRNGQGEVVQDTQWHQLVAWGKVADIVGQFLDKGSEVMVEGRLVHRNYIDKEGTKRYVSEVQVHNILLLDKKKEASIF
jgi:single-strand DNA-binding protein